MAVVKRLSDIGEFGFIRRVSRGCTVREEGVVLGVGDDAAVVEVPEGRLLLVTTDLLLEGVHFQRDWTTGAQLGHKALAVNLSDIAAMGGTAREAFVSLAAPKDTPIQFLDDVYEGMKALAREVRVNILGGDTTGSLQGIVLNVAVVGMAPPGEILTRAGAKPGDALVLSGSLGESRAGLRWLAAGRPPKSKPAERLLKAHLEPLPRLREGQFFAASGAVHAAIDVSDGLSSDLKRLAEASGGGGTLFSEEIPISRDLEAYCQSEGIDPIGFALAGGEDYALLLAVEAKALEGLRSEYEKTFKETLHVIGEVTAAKELTVLSPNGSREALPSTGWDHFASG